MRRFRPQASWSEAYRRTNLPVLHFWHQIRQIAREAREKPGFRCGVIMKKVILIAIASFLWKKYRQRGDAQRDLASPREN